MGPTAEAADSQAVLLDAADLSEDLMEAAPEAVNKSEPPASLV